MERYAPTDVSLISQEDLWKIDRTKDADLYVEHMFLQWQETFELTNRECLSILAGYVQHWDSMLHNGHGDLLAIKGEPE